jgi:hypothetical protein
MQTIMNKTGSFNKTIALLAFSFFISHFLFSQIRELKNGYVLPVKGKIRILVIFAEVDCGLCPGNCDWDNTNWPPGQFPIGSENWFDRDLSAGKSPSGYITRYYHEMSGGDYTVLGSYYPVILKIPCTGLTKYNASAKVIDMINEAPLPEGFNLSDFDNWSNDLQEDAGYSKANVPNKSIDALAIVWRNYLIPWGMQPFYQISTTTHIKDYKIPLGTSFHGINGSKAGLDFLIAEYFHGMSGPNNWHSGSGGGRHTFMTRTSSFSITGQNASCSNVVNGCDRWQMDWRMGKAQTIMARDEENRIDVPADFNIRNHPYGGTYILRDHVTTGDAIRIKLPHFNWTKIGDKKNQYLWIENHQGISSLDIQYYDDNECVDKMRKGMYVFIQVGKDVLADNDRIFLYEEQVTGNPNALASWLFPLTSRGNFDFKYLPDRKGQGQGPCVWGSNHIPKDRYSSETEANPFTGHSDFFSIVDVNNDGKLLSGDNWLTGLSEIIRDSVVFNFHVHSNSFVAFRKDFNSKINISSNPSSAPVYTHMSADGFGSGNVSPADFDNRKIRLNGVSVEIIQENTDGKGAIKVKITWDNYDVNEDQRWCGDIDLSNDPADPLTRPSRINLKKGKTLRVDQGRSATRYQGELQKDGSFLFAEPSALTLQKGTITEIEKRAKLIIENGSTFIIKSGATLTIKKKGKLIINAGSFLCIEPGAILKLDPKAKFSSDQSAISGVNPKLKVASSDCLKLDQVPQLKIRATAVKSKKKKKTKK